MAALAEAPTKKAAPAKFTLPLRTLQEAMATVAPAVERKTTIPILSMVRVEPLREAIEFTSTDLDLSIRATVRVPGIQPSSPMLMHAMKLEAYAKLLEGQDVAISADESRATIRCGRSNTRLPVTSPKTFPEVGRSPEQRHFSLKQDVLSRLIGNVAFSVSKEESRHTIAGALLEATSTTLCLVGTDGHRLARYTVQMDCEANRTVLPKALLAVLSKSLEEKSTAPISFASTENGLFFTVTEGSGSTEIGSRRLSAQFPNYTAVIPKQADYIVRVSAVELTAAVQRCLGFTDERSSAVDLHVSTTGLKLTAASDGGGETEETLDVASADVFEPFRTRFNGHYLLDALTRIQENVALRFCGVKTPRPQLWIVDSPRDGETFEYLVMSMNL